MDRLDPKKVFYHTEKLLELKKTGDTWPVHLQVGLTSHCNHKCIFCHGGHSVLEERNEVIDLDILLNALRQAKKHGLKAITLVGNGEPLIYPRIKELLTALYEMGLEIGIFTNGACLTEELRKFVVKYCTFIRFSVNGGTAEDHEAVHQTKDFDFVVNNIRELVRLKKEQGTALPTIGTQMVFYEVNYRGIHKAARLWREIGVDYFEIKPYVVTAFNLAEGIKPAQDAEAVEREMREAKAFETDKFKVFAKYTMYKHTLSKPSERTYSKCLGQAFAGNILEDGGVYICPGMEDEEPLGNINVQTFEEIWLGEKRKKILAELDVKKCPTGCRFDLLNEILWDYIHPARENHPDFI